VKFVTNLLIVGIEYHLLLNYTGLIDNQLYNVDKIDNVKGNISITNSSFSMSLTLKVDEETG
jgi:hypothetical protein